MSVIQMRNDWICADTDLSMIIKSIDSKSQMSRKKKSRSASETKDSPGDEMRIVVKQ